MFVAIPLQLTFAAMGEAAGGYDSTAVNPRTGRYTDAPVAAIAVDGQVTHEGDRVRQFLRDRAEAMYAGTGGRDLLDSDVFNLTRYSLIWQPNEVWSFHTDATYAIGSPTLFFSRAGRPDVQFARRGLAFPRQLIADYNVRQDAVIRPDELNLLQADVIVAGRYPATRMPRGQNMFTPSATLQWVHEFTPEDQGLAGVRGEYLSLELFRPVWVTQAFVGWTHRFDETFNVFAEGGITVVQENVGNDAWDAQPFFRARAYKRFDRQRLILGASYEHTFGVVSATLGTGALDIANATAWWMPGSWRFLVFGDVGFQHGEGYDPATQRPLEASFMNTTVGVRYSINPYFRIFARYEFQWETGSSYALSGAPDFVRHLALAGVQIAFGTDDIAVASVLPVDEMQALAALDSSSNASGPTVPTRIHDDPQDEPRRRRTRLPGDHARDAGQPTPSDPWEQQHLPGEETEIPGDRTPQDPVDPFARPDEEHEQQNEDDR
jgi:hypothetical protein